MVLAPSLPFRLVAAGVDEVLGQIRVLLFPGRLRELDQGQFESSWPGTPCRLVGPKNAVEEIGVFDRHIEQRSLAGGVEVGHGRLEQMAVEYSSWLSRRFVRRLPGSASV